MAVITPKDLRNAAGVALWFMFLTFPLLVIKINTVARTVEWRWQNLLWVGVAGFVASLVSRLFAARKLARQERIRQGLERQLPEAGRRLLGHPRLRLAAGVGLIVVALAWPFFGSRGAVDIATLILTYVMLGLGLNIVVGLAGLLDLGYVGFYAVGAYSYALLSHYYGLSFWMCLPIAGLMAAFFGFILGFPVLRLRGDYLAIVTLGFGEIIRLVLENWSEFSRGPSGIANIPRPGLFGLDLTLDQAIVYLYFLTLAMVLFTVFVVNRLQHSRIGRAWIALREDEIACQAMGIDKTRTKLAAFALGATWAGMAGVFFAAKTTFVNPASFTFLESAIILCIVVLGGMGSIVGVIVAALILILLPEYLRAFADYRMLVFGAVLVAMMVFRPQGLVTGVRRTYTPGR